MQQDQLHDEPYFLTRQTANLREDFGREIKKSASLFLLYGEEQVGKTRFLKELVSTNLTQSKSYWLDFAVEGIDEDVSDVSSRVDDSDSSHDGVDQAIELAGHHDVIIADHFQSASNKDKHKLLQSWATDGLDRQFNLIVSIPTSDFDEVCQLAAQYRLSVKSFQLMPLSEIEVDAYCANRLFPMLPQSSLDVSKQLRRTLKETKGVIGKVRQIVELQGAEFSMQTLPSNHSHKPSLIVLGLFGFILFAGLGFYFFQNDSAGTTSVVQGSDEEKTISIEPEEHSQTNETVEIENTEVIVQETRDDQRQSKVTQAELAVVEHTNIGQETEVEKTIEVEQETDQPEITNNDPDPDQKVKIVNELQDSTKDTSPASDGSPELSEWFKQELARSEKWIEAGEENQATIQIMSIGFNNFTDTVYLNYLETLKKKEVDVSKIRVYPTRVQGRIAYSVIYGEFENRQEAARSIQALPAALKANRPISRTIKGIRNEIDTL